MIRMIQMIPKAETVKRPRGPVGVPRRLVAIGLIVASVVGAGCENSTEPSAAPATTANTVDTSIRLGGDALTLRYDPGPRLVGDPIRLLVLAEPGDGAVATIELPDDGRLGAFDCTVLPAPRLAGLPMGSAVAAVELSTFESGLVELPPIEATFERGDGGAVRTLASAPLEFTIDSALAEGEASDPLAAVRPLKAPAAMSADEDGQVAAWWIASIALTTAVLVGGFLLLSRRRPPEEPPPAVWARERLAALRQDVAATPAERWAAAAAVLRGLLERRDGLDALDRTTAEIGRTLEADDRFDPAERAEILEILRRADLAKFAGIVDRTPAPAFEAIERLVEHGERRVAEAPRETAA